MDKHLQDVLADENFMQGDIICRSLTLNESGPFQWGFILNADCDIEQRKNSNLISWMEIVPAETFIDLYWSVGQIDKLLQKQIGPVCEQLNALLRQNHVGLSPLEKVEFVEWLQESGASAIFESIGVSDDDLRAKVSAIDALLRCDGEGLSTLLNAAEKFSQKRGKILEDARRSLEQPGGFADYVFVPSVPGSAPEGFVVRLRDISGVPENEVFRSRADARVHDKPLAFFRIGRFSDGVRYQIVQKMAFLFSRIGSPREFEESCKVAAERLVNRKKSEGTTNGI